MAARISGILNRHVYPGDDALLVLAALRFAEAGIGAELYPGAVESFPLVRSFMPDDSWCTVHATHALDPLTSAGRQEIRRYCEIASGRLRGLVVHDNRGMLVNTEQTQACFNELDQFLSAQDGPEVYVEYACGLEFEEFYGLIRGFERLRKIGVCIDIGHLAMHAWDLNFRKRQPELEVCKIKPDHPRLAELLPDIERAGAEAFDDVLVMVRRLAGLRVPGQLHLHNAHPLSTFSQYGVCDHLSFFSIIPLPFAYEGRASVDCIFTLPRLRELLRVLKETGALERMNFMLEIHHQPGRKALGQYEHIFAHWSDKTNAELMNYWIELVLQNATILRMLLDTI